MSVTFHEQTPVRLKNRKPLKLFISLLFKENRKELGRLDIIFCTDKYLREINKKFLLHDYYTDIITFNLSETKTEPISGEIYISADRIKENGLVYGSGFNRELHRVIFHGVLHLFGLNDKTKAEKAKMRKAEEKALSEYL